MYCPECGKEIPDVSKVCGFCGFRLPAQSEPIETPSAPAAVPDAPPVAKSSPQPQEVVRPAERAQTAPPAPAATAQAAPSPKISSLPGWAKGAIPLGAVALVVILLFAFGVIDLNGASSASAPVNDINDSSSGAPPAADSGSDPSASIYIGLWNGIDSDGSELWMRIEAVDNDSLTINGYDSAATGGCDGDPSWRRGESAYFMEDGSPVFSVTYACDEALTDIIGTFEIPFHYMPGTDQIEEETQEGYPSIYWDRVEE